MQENFSRFTPASKCLQLDLQKEASIQWLENSLAQKNF